MAQPYGIPAPHPAQVTALLATLMERVPTWECGALGMNNQFRLGSEAMETAGGDPALLGAGASMLLWGWRDNPLDTRLARHASAIMEANPGAAFGEEQRMAYRTHRQTRVPPDFEALNACLAAYPHPADIPAREVLVLVLPRLADPAHGQFWLARGVEWCIRHERTLAAAPDAPNAPGTPDAKVAPNPAPLPEPDDTTLETLLRTAANLPEDLALPASLADRLRAEWAVRRLPPAEALHRLDELTCPDTAFPDTASPTGPSAFAPWYALRRAELLVRLDRTEHASDAAGLLLPLWRATPYHPNLTLALHELLHPLPAPPADAPPPAILLYSWNKRDLAAQTLRSLRTAGFRGAPVFALDNGSQDDTGDMFRAMAANWGSPFTVVRLPVNVGAPAARNWLLSLPEVRQRDRAVFLDDDVLLDPGWLDGLLSVAHALTGWGAIGCAITDHTPPNATQCSDFFTIPPERGVRSFLDMDEQWQLYCNAAGNPEPLLTAYTRPCLSVSGCCHMISMASVQQVGAFDVRFTPSQFDDLERDIRCTLAGLPVWYTGTVRVRHMQHSSLRQATSRARSAHIFGNRIKLEHLHPANKARQAREASAALARQDLLRKAAALAAHGAP